MVQFCCHDHVIYYWCKTDASMKALKIDETLIWDIVKSQLVGKETKGQYICITESRRKQYPNYTIVSLIEVTARRQSKETNYHRKWNLDRLRLKTNMQCENSEEWGCCYSYFSNRILLKTDRKMPLKGNNASTVPFTLSRLFSSFRNLGIIALYAMQVPSF